MYLWLADKKEIAKGNLKTSNINVLRDIYGEFSITSDDQKFEEYYNLSKIYLFEGETLPKNKITDAPEKFFTYLNVDPNNTLNKKIMCFEYTNLRKYCLKIIKALIENNANFFVDLTKLFGYYNLKQTNLDEILKTLNLLITKQSAAIFSFTPMEKIYPDLFFFISVLLNYIKIEIDNSYSITELKHSNDKELSKILRYLPLAQNNQLILSTTSSLNTKYFAN